MVDIHHQKEEVGVAALTDEIASKEAELAQAREAMAANFDRYAGTTRGRGEQHRIRCDAQIRRGAQLADKVQRLERELKALQRQSERPTPPPLDLSKLPEAKFIRTSSGWYEVIKVNRASVKVKMPPGWDDLVKISKIVEIL